VREWARRIVVTGGAGFIGSHLVDALLATDVDEVVVIDNLQRGRLENLAGHAADARLRFIQGDIRDPEALRTALEHATVVYHLAAQATVMGGARDVDYTFTTNVVGTYNVLRAAAEHGSAKVVFASSREVYGEPVSLPVDEGHPLLSINSYGSSKVAGEALCRAFTRESSLGTAILRLANVYGQRDIGRVIPLWIGQARSGQELVVYGGQQIIDFVWVGDVVQALVRAGTIEVPLPPINIASGTGTKIGDLARRIAHLADSRAEIRIVPRRDIEVSRFIGSTDRMVQLLGIIPAADPLAQLPSMVRVPAGASA
jgi:UDP-glucose 4-epimerase